MKILKLIVILLCIGGCNKIRHENKAKDPPGVPTPAVLTEWTGKSDFTESKWSIKTQP